MAHGAFKLVLPVDVLADLLTRARARGALFSNSTLRAPWGLEFHDSQVALSVHAVLAGELWVERGGAAPLRVLQGDLLLVNSAQPYRFVHAPGAPSRPLTELLAAGGPPGTRRFAYGGSGAETGLVCGAYTLEGHVCDSLLAALPEVMPLPAVVRTDPALRTVLDLLTQELDHEAPGQQTFSIACSTCCSSTRCARGSPSRSTTPRPGTGRSTTRPSAPPCGPSTPSRRAGGRWPTSPPVRASRGRRWPAASRHSRAGLPSPT